MKSEIWYNPGAWAEAKLPDWVDRAMASWHQALHYNVPSDAKDTGLLGFLYQDDLPNPDTETGSCHGVVRNPL